MRIFIAVVLLILSLQSWTKADDISDFQIEGISIGDSLLDYFSEEEILTQKKITGFLYPNKDYFTARLPNNFGNIYEYFQFQIKDNDPKYIIYSVEGINFFNDMKTCRKDHKKIYSDIKDLFPKSKEKTIDEKHSADPTGKSWAYETQLYLKNGGAILISCYDWSDEITANKGMLDNLKVIIDSKEFNEWLNTKAFKP